MENYAINLRRHSVRTNQSPSSNPIKVPEQNHLGYIYRLSDAFPAKEFPEHKRGAMQGEGVCSAYNASLNDNYLYSLNAQSCVIVTLYNPNNQKGAVIHIDHNIRSLIDSAIQNAMNQLGNSTSGAIISTLTGGIWLGNSIGEPIKSALAIHGINPSWNQWSFSNCTAHCYGVVLDLQTGNVQTFEHSESDCPNFMGPLLTDTHSKKHHKDAMTRLELRANAFMKRCDEKSIIEKNGSYYFFDPEDVFKIHPKVTQEALHRRCISIYLV